MNIKQMLVACRPAFFRRARIQEKKVAQFLKHAMVCGFITCLSFHAALFSVSVNAQDFKSLGPRLALGAGQNLQNTNTDIGLPETVVRADKLKSIVFLTDSKKIKTGGISLGDGLDVSEVPELQTDLFKSKMLKFLGKPISLRSVEDLLAAVVAYYSESDRPFVVVTAPEQDITSGVLQVVVVEGKVGEIKVVGAEIFDEKIYRNAINLKPGDPISKRRLDANIEWLNRNPFRNASVFMEPGQAVGTTDLTVRVRERPPFRVYAGVDNAGTKVTGNNRVLLGVNFGNVFGLDHQFNYQYVTSFNFNSYRAHSATYIVPLSSQQTVTVFGAFADIKGDLPAPFALKGRSQQLGLRYAIPLENGHGWKQSIIGGLDFKRSNNNLEFGGAGVSTSSADVLQGMLSYDATHSDSRGTTAVTTSLFYSPGKLSGGNTDANFQSLRALSESRYAYANVQFRRVTQLPRDFSWHLSGDAQVASGNLLGSEQIGAGGYATVRGYNEREANGDEGFLLRNELRTPLFKAAGFGQGDRGQMQLLTFFDYGVVRNKRLLPGEAQHVSLSSVGFGLRYELAQSISARLDYGWKLHDAGIPGSQSHSRAHAALIVSF